MTKKKKNSPFDVTTSISSSVNNECASGRFSSADIDKFMTLQILSASPDTVLIADEFNAHQFIDGKLLYNSLHALVQPKRKRYMRWTRLQKSPYSEEDVEHIMEKYAVGLDTANSIIDVYNKVALR